MIYSIFAIYFKERCLYIGYSSNIPNYLKELKKEKLMKRKELKKIQVLAFQLFCFFIKKIMKNV